MLQRAREEKRLNLEKDKKRGRPTKCKGLISFFYYKKKGVQRDQGERRRRSTGANEERIRSRSTLTFLLGFLFLFLL
jgi:hypothetical protein